MSCVGKARLCVYAVYAVAAAHSRGSLPSKGVPPKDTLTQTPSWGCWEIAAFGASVQGSKIWNRRSRGIVFIASGALSRHVCFYDYLAVLERFVLLVSATHVATSTGHLAIFLGAWRSSMRLGVLINSLIRAENCAVRFVERGLTFCLVMCCCLRLGLFGETQSSVKEVTQGRHCPSHRHLSTFFLHRKETTA